MKTNLDYTTEIPHHDDESAVLKVSISNYGDGPIMSVAGEPHLSSISRISLNRTELESLLTILDRYEGAQKVMEGMVPNLSSLELGHHLTATEIENRQKGKTP